MAAILSLLAHLSEKTNDDMLCNTSEISIANGYISMSLGNFLSCSCA